MPSLIFESYSILLITQSVSNDDIVSNQGLVNEVVYMWKLQQRSTVEKWYLQNYSSGRGKLYIVGMVEMLM